MTQEMKLSKKQLDILQKMNSGWSLADNNSIIGGWWMQKGKLGCGGESIHKGLTLSCHALRRRGLIKLVKRGFPESEYALTTLGKEQVDDSGNSTDEQ